MTLQHKHLLSLCSLVVSERPSLSVFVSPCSSRHSVSWRTSGASPWERRMSCRLRSAQALRARTRGERRSAAYRGWSGTGARTLCLSSSARSHPSKSGHSPSLAPPWTRPRTPQTGCCCDPRPGTAGRGPAAALTPRGPAEGPGRGGTLDRTSGGSEPGRPDSSATQSSPGRRREPADLDAGASGPHGSPPVAQSQRLASLSLLQHTVSDSPIWRCAAGQRSAPLRSGIWKLSMLSVQTCGDQGLTQVSFHSTSAAERQKVRNCSEHALPQFSG